MARKARARVDSSLDHIENRRIEGLTPASGLAIGSSCYKSIDQFVKDFYQGVLKRQPNASELSSAATTLNSAQATSASA